MGVSPKHLKRFAGGYGRDLQGVELLFEESGGGLVGEIVNAKIDPIGLFRGKPFFFALLFAGLSRPEDQIPKSMGDPIELDSPQCSSETPGKGREDS